MRTILSGVAALLLVACAAAPGNEQLVGWRLVYENDAGGQAVSGSKSDLIAAVRAGKPVRVHTVGRRIEHAAEVKFLSVFGNEVFAQLPAIESQRPQMNPLGIAFRRVGQKWRSIVGSNGFVTAYTDGGEPNVRAGATRWFVQD